MYPSQTADRFIVRMPNGLRDQLRDIAASNRRSMNSEIVLMLERALASAAATTGASFAGATPAVALDETALQGGPINPRG